MSAQTQTPSSSLSTTPATHTGERIPRIVPARPTGLRAAAPAVLLLLAEAPVAVTPPLGLGRHRGEHPYARGTADAR
ncbi:hypothetical protein AB0D35_22350 [Streptomyces sp. NPDC048301]|uniref:hypothetical protein n=1 Tax=unclassified Streptomyces TaxID=2593676 RepID=UPI003438C015